MSDVSTKPRLQLGPFELQAKIGQGGMGDIWSGRHIGQDVPVALKVLTEKGARSEEYVASFRNEIRAVAALDHPGIVLLFDHGEVSLEAEERSEGTLCAGSPYLVMEYAERGSLERYLHAFRWRHVREILLHVLDALSHAHARGVIHRDLKPQNLLVGCHTTGGFGMKLADFGLAHPFETTDRSGTTEEGWGTPYYMAPEQIRGLWRDYGPWTDLYALGCMAWEMTTGQMPFDGENVGAVAQSHLVDELGAFEPRMNVPEGFESWLRRLIVRDFRQRFERAADAAWALIRICDEVRVDGDDPYSSIELPRHRMRQLEDAAREAPTAQPVPHDAPTVVSGGGAETTILLDAADPATAVGAHHTLRFEGRPAQVESSGTPADAAKLHVPMAAEPPPMPERWHSEAATRHAPRLAGVGLGLYGLRRVPMVGRQRHRDVLWQALGEAVDAHQLRVVLLEGEAGCGKSRLAEWLCERGEEVGAAEALEAYHSPVAGPADGLPRMLARHLRCVGLDRDGLGRRVERELRALGVTEPYEWEALTELLAPGHPDEAVDDASKTHRVRLTNRRQRDALIRRMLERLARRRPLVVWLDDVQWGADALHFVEYLVEVDVRAPILVVMTARRAALDEQAEARQAVKRLMRAQPSARLTVEPLGAEDTDALVRELLVLDEAVADQVEARSGGNPLFAVQLVGDWVAAGKLTLGPQGFELGADQSASLPDDIHQLWSNRIARLAAASDAPVRAALQVGAALGQEVDEAEWRGACQRLGLELGAHAAGDLVSAGLVRPLDQGPLDQGEADRQAAWMFVHGLLRESLERAARDDGQWTAINAACAAELRERYGADNRRVAERVGRHLAEAGRPAEALWPLLRAAGWHAERSDFETALGVLDRRQALLDEVGVPHDDPRRADGWLLRAEISAMRGRYRRAHRLADEAVAAVADAAPRAAIRALTVRGRAERHLARHTDARRTLDDALALADASSEDGGVTGGLRGLVELELGRLAQVEARYAAADRHLEAAAAYLESTDDTRNLGRCYNALGDVARLSGRADRAARFAEQSRALFEATGNRIGVADCLGDLAELRLEAGDLAEAERLSREAVSLYETVGSSRAFEVSLTLAEVLVLAGRAADAAPILDVACERFERLERHDHLLVARTLAVWSAAVTDRTDRVIDLTNRLVHRSAHARIGHPSAVQALREAAAALRERGRDILAARVDALLP